MSPARAALAIALCAGCAAPADRRDALEPVNRVLHAVHGLVDGLVLEPASQLYAFFLPPLVREGVGNVLSNLTYLDTVLNALLQGKLEQGGSDLARFALNSTVGLAGVFDVATGMGFDEHEEDFGQTLAHWGVPAGSYLVLPILGPRTARDLASIPVSLFTSPLPYLGQASAAGGLFGLYLVDRRAGVDGDFLRRAREAADPYAFLREAWLSHREFLIRDGAPSEGARAEDLLRELEGLDALEEAEPPEQAEEAEQAEQADPREQPVQPERQGTER